jgi:hypothetical protein
VGSAIAHSATGGFCRAGHFRLDGAAGTVRKQALWTYKEGTAPYHPIFGWVDLACWNTGGEVPIDIAKRSWFAVAGPEGGAASAAAIHFANSHTMSGRSSGGVTAEGVTLYGSVGPGHDCVFEVRVWQDACPDR